ncbi:MAG TPA: hypothetical protein VEK08_27100 [Planctomycetota bacterium]|nr:hypothetical protein [Planctomycetota bacterium]
MKALVLSATIVLALCLSGCGDKKPKAFESVEDAAAKKAKSVENFASDRLQVKE